MRYDLISASLDCTFYIECHLADKPETLGELFNGVFAEKIHWQPDYEKKMKKLYENTVRNPRYKYFDMSEPLLPDFRTQKPIRHNINWPPTENLK